MLGWILRGQQNARDMSLWTPYWHALPQPSEGDSHVGQIDAKLLGRRFATLVSKRKCPPEDVATGYDEFLMATKGILLPREQQAAWLELRRQRKHGRIPNWKDALLVSDCGSSLGFLSITHGMFPCVRPGNKYLILKHGEARIAQGPECLAVQGIWGG